MRHGLFYMWLQRGFPGIIFEELSPVAARWGLQEKRGHSCHMKGGSILVYIREARRSMHPGLVALGYCSYTERNSAERKSLLRVGAHFAGHSHG